MQDELYHHGIKGQKWGVRRYQNPDGTLTEAGRARYGLQYNTMKEVRDAKRSERRIQKALKTGNSRRLTDDELRKVSDRLKAEQSYKQMFDNLNPKRKSRAKRVIAEIAETAAKDLVGKAFRKLGEKIFEKKSPEKVSEYSFLDMDRLTDKQLDDYKKRLLNKKLISDYEVAYQQNYKTVREEQNKKAVAEKAAKDAQQAVKDLKRSLNDDRNAEQNAQRAREKAEERAMIDNISKSKFDSWMKEDYTKALPTPSVNEYDDWYKKFYHSGLGDDFLEHHGIKGQKWGVRRFQNPDGTLTAAGKQRYYEGSSGKNVSAESYSNYDDEHKQSKKDYRRIGIDVLYATLSALMLNPVGVITNVADIAAVLATDKIADKKTEKIMKSREDDEIDKKTGLPLKKREMTDEEDLKMINPGFKNMNNDTKSNCTLCSATYDLRKRGYDVIAQTASVGYTDDCWAKWYKGAKSVDISGLNEKGKLSRKILRDNTLSELGKQPDGARGTLLVAWKGGMGGHSLIYQKKDGKIEFLDGQSNDKYGNELFGMVDSVSYVRFDNLTPIWDEIKKEVCR